MIPYSIYRFVIFLFLFGGLGVYSGCVTEKDKTAAKLYEMIESSRDGYAFMWWANGWRGEKIRCLQTSSYGMAMDISKMSIRHFGEIKSSVPYEQAVAQPNKVVMDLPAANMVLSVEFKGRKYLCLSGSHPRLIESGRFLQRSDIEGLVFKTANGKVLPAECRLEIIAWPDRLSLFLEVRPQEDMKAATASIRFNAETHSINKTSARVDWMKGDLRTFSAVLFERFPETQTHPGTENIQAFKSGSSEAIPVIYDVVRGWHKVELPAKAPDEPDAASLQRIRLHLKNPGKSPRVVRLNFAREGNVAGITGLVPLLRDARHNPTGIPVQISKNWHKTPGKTYLYQGTWMHALTMMHIPGQFEADLEFCISRNFWGKVPLASHAQLCLIGWGTDQLWDEAAIGSWGESICYDPDVCLQRSVIDDMRPLMVRQMNTKNGKWGWTNNVGGGDFLVYFDEDNRKQFLTRMRTAYLSQGPNLTEVIYAGISPDGNLSATIRVMTPRCDDINRAYHTFRYEVLKPTKFKRMAFYQIGADKYNDHQFHKLARGNETGLLEEWPVMQGGNRYHRKGIPCPGRMVWFSLHEAVNKDKKGGAWANRGLIIRSWKARLGGKECAPFAASYGTRNGPVSCTIELTPPPELTELQPGDFVEATVELLVLPQYAHDYYGPNERLRKDLKKNENTWKLVLRQASNGALAISMLKGNLQQSYPLQIAVDSEEVAEFTLMGGVGYFPITFTGLPNHRGWKLSQMVNSNWSEIDQSVFGKDFWQTSKTADDRFAITFNVLLDARAGLQRFQFINQEE